MADDAVAVADVKPGVPLSTKKAVIRFFGPRGVSSSPVATKTMAKSAMIGAGDEVLGAVQHPVAAVPPGRAFMPRRSDPAPGSVIARQSMRLAPDAGQQIALALFAASQASRMFEGRAKQVQCSA